jgi:hypothetical protein
MARCSKCNTVLGGVGRRGVPEDDFDPRCDLHEEGKLARPAPSPSLGDVVAPEPARPRPDDTE